MILLEQTLPAGASAGRPRPTRGPGRAFTLLELLVVIAILALLASLLLPALAAAKAKGRRAACTSNLKQLAVSTHLYVADNNGRLPDNNPLKPARGPTTNTWLAGDMTNPREATNSAIVAQGELFPYANQVSLYRCPSDASQVGGTPRARSYAMNGWMGSRYMETLEQTRGYRTFVRDSELSAARAPALWLLVDEHEASIDDSWFLVTMDDRQPFASFPATRHDRGYGLNFVDGHAELYPLRDPQTLRLSQSTAAVSPSNPDWQRLKRVTTVN